MLGNHKVLIQWLPTSNLRTMRRLKLGPKYASPVQQTAIQLLKSPDLFPLAMSMATQRADGSLLLQVGFSAPTRVSGGAWVFDGPEPADAHFWDEDPELDELLVFAERANPPDLDLLTQLKELCANIVANYGAGVQKTIEDRGPNPFFDSGAFFSMAHHAPEGAGASDLSPDEVDMAIPSLLVVYPGLPMSDLALSIVGSRESDAVDVIEASLKRLADSGQIEAREEGGWRLGEHGVVKGGEGGALGAVEELTRGQESD